MTAAELIKRLVDDCQLDDEVQIKVRLWADGVAVEIHAPVRSVVNGDLVATIDVRGVADLTN